MRSPLIRLLLLLLALLPALALATPPAGAQLWTGPEDCSAVEAVRRGAEPGWQALTTDTPHDRHHAWVRLPLPPAWPSQMLVLPTVAATQLTTYLPGVAEPVRRDVHMPTPPHVGTSYWHSVLMLAPAPGEVLLCLQGRRIEPAAVTLVPAERQIERELDVRTLLSVSMAVILAMSAFALAFWVTLRDGVYLRYLGHLLAVLLFAGLNEWSLARFLVDLPGAPLPMLYLRAFSMALSAALTLAFARQFLELGQRAPRLDRILGRIVWTLLLFGALEVLALAGTSPMLSWILLVENLLAGACVVLLGSVVLRLAWQGQRQALYFCVAWTPFLLVVLTSVVLTVTGAESAQVVRLWQLPAAAFEAFLLSVGLADRALALKRERDAALHQAEHDALTSVLNRRGFECRLKQRLDERAAGTLLVCDLDHFKRINDRWGHPAGDRCLQVFVERAARVLPRSAELGRLGGEEFAILLRESGPAAHGLAERLRLEVSEVPVVVNSDVIALTVSIGLVGIAAGTEDEMGRLFERADAALYSAKTEGRNRVVDAERVGALDRTTR
jgi:diguanylate cyclase (GGDEF)-like protein